VLVRRVSAQEWVELRELRLRALADAPDAFLTTLAEVQGRSDDDWCEWAEHSAKSMDSAVFVDDGFSGLAGAFVQEPGVVMLFGMWVAPERRGSGLASALVDAVVAWARGLGAGRVVLWVVVGNGRAQRLYEKSGFAPTGVRKPVRSGIDAELALDL